MCLNMICLCQWRTGYPFPLLKFSITQRCIEPAPMLALTAGILTDSQFSKANILKVKGDAIKSALENGFYLL